MERAKLSAKDTLLMLMDEITISLEEVCEFLDEECSGPGYDFANGSKHAYITCLEILQAWEEAEENGLDFDIEKVFRL